jgi:hypothetical protein
MFPQYLGEFFIEPILIADFERELMAFGEFPQEGTQAREELGAGLELSAVELGKLQQHRSEFVFS